MLLNKRRAGGLHRTDFVQAKGPHHKTRSEAGITLIEMLVVVTIIMLFIGIVGFNLLGQAEKAKRKAAITQINSFRQQLQLYKLQVGTFPSTEQGLQALHTKPEGVEGWEGPYSDRDIPTDPWHHPYVYKYPGEHGDEPDITSYGADGQPGGEGNDADIESWRAK